MESLKVAAVVILYKPEMGVIVNINSYIDQVDKIFVIDNSENTDALITVEIKEINKVEYIWNKTNIGIAAALNVGIKKALEEGFGYLLTMDQDSRAPESMVACLLENFAKDSHLALIAPRIRHAGIRNHKETNSSIEKVFSTWTSGSLMRLDIFKNINGFLEKMFIDYVDHEFCLRLNKFGFNVLISNGTYLLHNLGKIESKNFFFRKVYYTNHSALRLYYRTRNRFLVKMLYKKEFPGFFKQDDKDFWKSFLKVILFEKDKKRKIKFSILGYWDYRKNRFGKFESNNR